MGNYLGRVMRHISHHDSGYKVEITRDGKRYGKWYSFSCHDDPLELAVKWRNRTLMELDGELPPEDLAVELLERNDSTLMGDRSSDVRKVTGVSENGQYRCISHPWWGALASLDFAITLLKGYVDEGSKWVTPSGEVRIVRGAQMEPQELQEVA